MSNETLDEPPLPVQLCEDHVEISSFITEPNECRDTGQISVCRIVIMCPFYKCITLTTHTQGGAGAFPSRQTTVAKINMKKMNIIQPLNTENCWFEMIAHH